MPSVGIDKLIDKTVYVKSQPGLYIYGYKNDLKTQKAVFNSGALIGKIYSWVTDANGNIYFMFYLNNDEYKNFIPTYVKVDTDKINIPELPGILEQIAKDKDKKDREEKGIVQYNIDKYLPYIIGAAVVAIALPSVINSSKKVGSMTNKSKKNTGLLVAAAAGIAIYLYSKKKKTKAGIPLTEDLGGGIVSERVQNIEGSILSSKQQNNIRYVGPFQVEYSNMLSGVKKGDLGAVKIR